MECSTPMVPTSDLRRRTILQNAVHNMSPLRRSINPETFKSPLLEVSNDESERLARRSNVEIQRRLSSITPERSPLNESFIKEQFTICTHLFTENKITTKNAWKLQIIDILKPLLSHKASKDNLQVASTSIDICAKVYCIRVDDIHSDGLKLASSMARVNEKQPPQDTEDDGGDDDSGHDKEKQNARKKKKKRSTGQKTTVTNIKSTLSSLPKLEPVDFTARVNADTGAIDNLFTNVLKEDNSSISFAFLDRDLTLFSKDDPLVTNSAGDTTPMSTLPLLVDINNIRLNTPFNDFKLDDWDPDQEEKMLDTERTVHSQNNEVVFDEQGIPIPELDGSIPDIFENHNDDVDADNDVEFVQEMIAPQLRGEVARIVDFRSIGSSVQRSEYSYNPIVCTHSGNYIDQIWAGPCHWKLKFLQRNSTRFSGARTEVVTKQRKKKAPPEMICFSKPVEIDFSKRLVIRKRPPTVDINKITLPIRYNNNFEETIDELMLKPGVRVIEKKIVGNLDYEVGPYKYENPNDSLYCSQAGDNGPEDADNGPEDADNGPFEDNFEREEHVMPEHQGLLGENLVDAPQMVPEAYIPYAMKAKQMDMKKLKSAIWQKLTNCTIIVNKESQQRSGIVIPTVFSEMYSKVPEVLAEKEKKELTCPLAFVALLHLCNEQNLYLKQLPGYKDFEIIGPK